LRGPGFPRVLPAAALVAAALAGQASALRCATASDSKDTCMTPPMPPTTEATLDMAPPPAAPLAVPRYLQQVYWWAYVHPNAVHVFEREWLVNAILFGNYGRLR